MSDRIADLLIAEVAGGCHRTPGDSARFGCPPTPASRHHREPGEKGASMTVPCARRSSVDDQAEYRGPEGRPFAVADSIYCCWDFDHGTRTLEYLEGIDPDYFSTIATFLAQQLESKDAIAISVALRVLYHQGVETL